MIRLTIYSGMRNEEILALQWDAVDLRKRLKKIAITASMYSAGQDKDLNKWENRAVGDPYAPDYISDIMNKLIERYRKETGTDLDGVTFHKLRHSCCSILYDKGWSLGEVQQCLGQEDSEITKRIYLHKQETWKGNKAQDLKFLWEKHNEVS